MAWGDWRMRPGGRGLLCQLLLNLGLTILLTAAGKFQLAVMALEAPYSLALWLTPGISTAAALLLGWPVVPGIFCGTLAAQLWYWPASWPEGGGFALINAAADTAVALLQRWLICWVMGVCTEVAPVKEKLGHEAVPPHQSAPPSSSPFRSTALQHHLSASSLSKPPPSLRQRGTQASLLRSTTLQSTLSESPQSPTRSAPIWALRDLVYAPPPLEPSLHLLGGGSPAHFGRNEAGFGVHLSVAKHRTLRVSEKASSAARDASSADWGGANPTEPLDWLGRSDGADAWDGSGLRRRIARVAAEVAGIVIPTTPVVPFGRTSLSCLWFIVICGATGVLSAAAWGGAAADYLRVYKEDKPVSQGMSYLDIWLQQWASRIAIAAVLLVWLGCCGGLTCCVC